jgi:hypothetical protein
MDLRGRFCSGSAGCCREDMVRPARGKAFLSSTTGAAISKRGIAFNKSGHHLDGGVEGSGKERMSAMAEDNRGKDHRPRVPDLHFHAHPRKPVVMAAVACVCLTSYLYLKINSKI